MKLLYITANPKPIELSFSLQLGQHFLDKLESLSPGLEVEHVDVYKDDIPLIDWTVLQAWDALGKGQPLPQGADEILNRMNVIVNQFLDNNLYVFATPLWNLSYPPMFKAYIDNIVVARKTFMYTETGAVGLLKDTNKTAVHIQAAGGVHSHGPVPEYAEPHLKAIMEFMGVDSYHHIVAEGMAFDPSKAQGIVDEAKGRLEKLAQLIIETKTDK